MFRDLNKRIFNISYRALRTIAALVVAALITTSHLILSDFVLKDNKVYAAFNKQINYQGKLTNSSGVAVANGSYIMKFRLYTTASSATTTNIWEEIRTATGDKATVTNGLFSVMLGSSTAFTGIDFNQTLYLGVEVCGTTGLSGCDNEMSPRKILGAVPAAFVADTLDGLSSEQFLRTDAVNSTSTASNFLTITQIGAGNVAEFYGTAAVTPAFSILSNGKIGVGSSTPLAQFSASTTNSIAAIFDQRGTSDILQLQKSGFNLFNFTSTGRLGIGSTSPYAALAVAGEIVADIFTSTSTTATSTFANHISIGTGKEFRIGGIGILTRSGTAIIGGDLSGNTRGAGSLDIQGSRNALTQVASGATSTALGNWNTASAASTTAVGINNSVTSIIASAFGYSNSISGANGATASGYGNSVTGAHGSAFGITNTVSGAYSSASGYRNNVSGLNGVAFGYRNTVQTFNSSIAFGMLNLTGASSTSAFGFGNSATAVSASVFGQNITNNIATSTQIGPSDAAKLTILGGTGAVGYVGVGTSTPYARLTVWGAGTGTGILANFANNASTTVFTALDNGNIGIGSSSPFAKLSVAGNSLGTGIIFALSTSTASATNTAFVIDANGKVGIGTTSPSSQLAIAGGWFTTASSTGMNGINLTNGCFAINGTCVGGSGGGSGTVSSGLAGQTAFYNADGTTVSGTSTIFTSTASKVGIGSTTPWAKLSVGSFGGTAPQFVVASSTGSSATSTDFIVDQFGNVGVGTTSPWAKFSVAGQAVADYFTAVSTTATSTFAYDASVTGRLSVLQTSTNATIIGDTTGNPRGTNATDVQSGRTAATQVAGGFRNSAFGYGNTTGNNYSVALGYSNTASAFYATAVGYLNTATGSSHTAAFGSENAVSGNLSNAFGSENIVSGALSNAFGALNKTYNVNTVVFGKQNYTGDAGTGLGAVAVGLLNNQTGATLDYTTAVISGTATGTATVGRLSGAFGIKNTSSGNYAQTFGYQNTASGAGSSAFGSDITNTIASSTMIGPSNSAKLTILGGTGAVGYVGVGTSTPYARLTVWGAGTGTGILANFANNASTTVFTALDNGNIGIGSSSPFAKFGVAGNSLGTGIIFALSTSTASATNTAFVIDANGKVGIGTTSPSSQLAIAGGWFTTASSTGMNGINLTNGCFAINGTCVGGSGGGSGTVSSGLAGQTAFYNADGTTVSGTSTIFTSTASKVGIGSTTPWAKLSVGSFGGTAPQFVVASSTGSSATSTDFIVDQFGNVGVGTTSPWAKFSVAGQAVADYFTAVSTTATSTFAYDAAVTGRLKVLDSSLAVIVGDVTGNVRGANAIDVQSSHTGGVTRVASGAMSSAFGYNNLASGSQTSASGYSNAASADYASAIGHINTASGQYASAIGNQNTASAYRSSAIGKGNIAASASGATSIGITNTSAGAYASAFGYLNIVTGVQTSAFGAANKSYSLNATVLGNRNFTGDVSTGLGAVAVGLLNNQTGATLDYTTAVISGTATGTATVGRLSGAFGIKNTSSGNYAQTFGYQNTASGAGSSAFGSDITNTIASSTMIGPSNSAKLTILGGTGAVGYVGVGTSTPYARLTVWGAGTGTGILANFANNASTTVFTALDNGNIGIGSSSPFAKFGVAGNSLGTGIIFALSTSTASATNTAFVIDANGKVGIGTTSPSSQLAIAGGWFTTASSTGMNGINLTNGCFAINGTCVGGSSGGGTVTGSGIANQIAFWSGASAIAGGTDFLFNSATGRMSLGATTTPFGQLSINTSAGTSSLVVGSSTGTHFIVDQFGNVGIGTSSPFTRLSVNGQAAADYFTSTSNTVSTFPYASTTGISTNGLTINTSVNGPLQANAGVVSATSSIGVLYGGTGATSFAANSLIFYNGTSFTSTSTHPLYVGAINATSTTINSYFNSSVGLSSTTPFAQLSVNTLAGSPALAIGSSTGTYFTVDSQGNTGVGTSSPFAKLSVQGVSQTTAGQAPLAFAVYGGTGSGGSTIAGGSALMVMGNGSATGLSPAGAGGSMQFISGNGGVSGSSAGGDGGSIFISGGYGGSGSSNGAQGNVLLGIASSSASAVGKVSVGTSTPYARLTVWGAGTGTGILANFANNASTSVFTLLDNGNLGLGTTSPYARLSVAGQVVADYFTATSTTATSTFAWGIQANLLNITSTAASSTIAGGLRITGGGLAITTLPNCNGTSVLETDSAGVVTCGADAGAGAGITGAGTAGQVGFWDTSSSQAGSTDFKFSATTGRMSLGATTTPFGQLSINTSAGTSSLVIGSSTGTHFIVDQFGNVGIGTSSPFTRLSVNGQAAADYFTAVSTTATSTFAYDARITGVLRLGQANGSVVIGDVTGNVRGTNAVDIQSSRPFGATRVASGVGSLAIGFNNSAGGNYSTASGYRNSSSGAASFAVGYQNTASVLYSFALGVNNTASGLKSTASGYKNTTSGNYASTFGSYITNDVASSTQIGSGSLAKLTILGSTGKEGFTGIASTTPWAKLSVNPLAGEIGFVIGSSTATNFIVDQNGNVGIGSTSPWGKLSIMSNTPPPEFVVATSSGVTPLFYVDATTTGVRDWARVAVGTTTGDTQGSSGLRDQLTVGGRLYTTWRYASCDFPGMSVGATAVVTANTSNICGPFAFLIDTTGYLNTVTNYIASATPAVIDIGTGTVNSTSAVGTGAGIRVINPIFSATSSPILEAVVSPQLSSSTIFIVGFTDSVTASDLATVTGPLNGAYFAASTSANWIAVVRRNNGESRIDTGVATSSVKFQRLRVEINASSSATFLINGNVVAEISTTTFPTANLGPQISVGNATSGGGAGFSKHLYISQIRMWAAEPVHQGFKGGGGGFFTGGDNGGGISSEPPMDVENFDAFSSSAIATSYLVEKTSDYSVGSLVSIDDQRAVVHMSTTTYDKRLLGVVSDNSSSQVLGTQNEHTIKVATIGRTQVRVSAENGNVAVGDYLTSSKVAGVAMKATGSGRVIGRALQSYVENEEEDNGIIAMDVEPAYYGGGAFTVTSSGNMGIGTSTPNMKLDVLGDVGANGFVAHANKNLMKDIALLGDTDYQAYLDKIRNININTYRYNTDAAEVPTRLGLLADQAPSEVLSITGDVDVYKLATFTLAGVKAQQLKIDSLDQRLTTLEEIVANGGFATTTATSTLPIVSYFESLGVKISQDLASFKNVIVETLTVGSAEKPTGITLYDDVTGLPYCLKISNGQPKSEAGKCGSEKPVIVPPTIPPIETNSSSTPSIPTEPSTPSTEPVVDAPKVETLPVETPPPAPPAEAPAPAPAPPPPAE